MAQPFFNTSNNTGRSVQNGAPAPFIAIQQIYQIPDVTDTQGVGLVSLSGTATGTLSFVTTGAGALDVSGTATDVLAFVTTATGSITLTGAAYLSRHSPQRERGQ